MERNPAARTIYIVDDAEDIPSTSALRYAVHAAMERQLDYDHTLGRDQARGKSKWF